MPEDHPNAQLLLNTAKGFDHLFSNDIDSARTHFQSHDDPSSLLGTGFCAFLEAALGMEVRNKTSFLSNETMFYHRWVSWQKRHAALSSLRLARDNVCEFPNPEIWHIMVVSNTDWSGRYWMLTRLYFWGWPILSGRPCLIPRSIYLFTFYSPVSLTWDMFNACWFSIYFSSFSRTNR